MPAPPISPLLAHLSPDERSRLLDRAVPRRLDAGSFIHLTGEASPRVHLVSSGIVKLAARDTEGRETILGLAVAGDLLGDAAAIEGVPQLTDAVAVTACSVVGFDARRLIEVLRGNPGAALEVARTMAGRLRWLGTTAMERTCAPAPARLAGRLLDLAELIGRGSDGGYRMDLPLPQTDLGRLAGISRESTCKALRRLKQQGVLDYSRRGDLTILRPDILAAIRSEGTRLTVAPGGLDLGDPLRWPPASERARKKASPGRSRFQSEIPNT
jgi:CRP/FNR family transcriptional regulator, cyclic AMP receptor protein